jgi:16S rRNA (guanine527-N7)-methyltransferase
VFHVKQFDAEAFHRVTGVSRETLGRLEAYVDLLRKWQRKINLIGRGTVEEIWYRHIYDSAQLLSLAPRGATTWVDVGSGAGFPGMVLAILGAGSVYLVECDERKSAFLSEASRLCAPGTKVVSTRVENLVPGDPRRSFAVPDVVTARALAPLSRLLGMVTHLCGPETVCLFPRGQDVEKELTALSKYPNIIVDTYPSRTDPGSTVLSLRGVGDGERRDEGGADRFCR